MSPLKIESTSPEARIQVAYYGPARISDDLALDCAVLEDGRRGYVMRGLQKAIGITGNRPLIAFRGIIEKIAPNSLTYMDNTSSMFHVRMPNGASGLWVEEGILTELSGGVIDAAIEGRLHKNQMHMVPRARVIMKALAKAGERGLIDEATGYQYHRAADDLQSLVSRLIRQSASDWERRFPESYYRAICRLFGFKYEGRHRPLPAVVGQITLRFVYEAIFPDSILAEIKARRKSEKLHQWLSSDGGMDLLLMQIGVVTALAGSAADYRDFEARCSHVMPVTSRQIGMIFPAERLAA